MRTELLNPLQALADALWLADLDTKKAWANYECGHGATYAMKCPLGCAAWRRMTRLHANLNGGAEQRVPR